MLFKPVDGGFITDVDYMLSGLVPGLSITFKNAHDYSSVAKKGGLAIWAIVMISVGCIGCVLVSILAGLFRWHKARTIKRVEDEAAKTKPVVSKRVEKPEPVVTNVDETKPNGLKQTPKSKKTRKVKDATKLQPISGISTDDGLLTAKDTPSKTIESYLKTPDFAVKRIDRPDMLKKTAQTTEATADTLFELTPYKIPEEFCHQATPIVIEPQRRHQIYFSDGCVPVFDACNQILIEVEVAVKEEKLNGQKLVEFRKEVPKIKCLCMDVYTFLFNDLKTVHLSQDFKKTLDFSHLTEAQVQEETNYDMPTEVQFKNITRNLKQLWKQRAQMAEAKDANGPAFAALVGRINFLYKS